MASPRVVVVGAGIFGVTASIELARRGCAVSLLDPGPVPHPLAASTDVSKVVRMEYGSSEEYATLAERSLEGWRRWNRELGVELYHETGILHLRRGPMTSGFERESWDLIVERGKRPERVDRALLEKRFPAWNSERFRDGFFHGEGGWVESGRVVARLADLARSLGVLVREGVAFEELLVEGSRCAGVVARTGEEIRGERVLCALGAWTPHLLPFLKESFRSSGMPVFHLKPRSPELFRAERFPVFTADIAQTGYYGFPLHPEHGIVKVARHGAGREMHPESKDRVVTDGEIADLRAFLEDALPALADAELVSTRVCLYCDSWDGDFWIAPDPSRDGLVVAAGDSGHAFKFAPVLGALIADAVLGEKNDFSFKFRWRPEIAHASRKGEAARFLDEDKKN